MKSLYYLLAVALLVACQQPVEEPEAPDHAAQVAKLYNYFAEGNVDAVLAGLTEDVEWNEAEGFIYYNGGAYVGRDAVLEGVFARVGGEWEYWNLADLQIENLGSDKALATGRYQAKHKETGKMLDAQFAHVWTMRDTLAMRFQQYTDTKQAAEAVMADTEEGSEEGTE